MAKRNQSAINSLRKIETSMTSAGRKVQTRIDKITDFLETEEGGAQVEAITSAVEKIGDSMPSVTSDDTLTIVSGALDIISAVTSLIPVAGPIIGTVFSLISSIIGGIGAGAGVGSDFGSIVKKEIEKALNHFDDSQLRAEAEGTMRQFRISHAYLSAKDGDDPIKENEIPSLSANVPVYEGINFLGFLSQKVKERSNSTNADQVKQAIEYTQLYITLAVLRSAVLWEMYALVRTVPNNDWTADAIQRVAEIEESHDKEFIEYLTQPDYSSAVFFSNLNLSQWPEIKVFLEKKGLFYQKLDQLASGTHSLRPEKWQNYYMAMMNDREGLIYGTVNLGNTSRFWFDPILQDDNVFHIRSVEWPNWYVYMLDHKEAWCRGWEGAPGPAGEWKIVRLQDGKYMLAPRRWPDWFIYMKDEVYGQVRGWEGDPGTQGHWIID